MQDLKFSELRELNVNRCEDAFAPLDSWNPTEWGCALAGEVGELCNMLKKCRRANFSDEVMSKWLPKIKKEVADCMIYLDLLSANLRINLAEATIEKFNEVSLKKGSDVRLVGTNNKENQIDTPPHTLHAQNTDGLYRYRVLSTGQDG